MTRTNNVIRVNEQIRANQVRLIDNDGSQVGVISIHKAREIAREKQTDLLEIVPDASPPVVKLQDYDKYRYEIQKREKEAKKAQKASVIITKELRFRPNTQEHDIQILVKQGMKFLEKGDRLKLSIMTKGRERSRMNEFLVMLEDVASRFGEIIFVSKPSVSERQAFCIIELPR